MISSAPNLVTNIICSIIGFILVSGICFRILAHNRKLPLGELTKLAPMAVITLGIFGTFLGIYLGLLEFDTSDINGSIPKLLEGLKTAFITSLVGMFSSLILRYVFSYYDKKDISKETIASDDPIVLLRQIANEVSSLTSTAKAMGETIIKCFHSDEEFSMLSQLKLIRSDMNDLKREIKQSLDEFSEKVSQLGTAAMINALRDIIEQFNAKLNDLVGEEFKQLKEAMLRLVEWQDNYKIAVDEMQSNLTNYLAQIESSLELLQRISNTMQVTSNHLNEIDSSLSSISVSADDIEQHIEGLKMQNSQLEALLNNIVILGENAKDVLPSITQHLNDATSNLENAAAQTEKHMDLATSSLKTTVENTFVNLKEATEKHTEQMNKNLKALEDNLQVELSNALNILAQQLAALSTKFAEDYTPLTERLREIVSIARKVDEDQRINLS